VGRDGEQLGAAVRPELLEKPEQLLALIAEMDRLADLEHWATRASTTDRRLPSVALQAMSHKQTVQIAGTPWHPTQVIQYLARYGSGSETREARHKSRTW
jgi:hypothetical protein